MHQRHRLLIIFLFLHAAAAGSHGAPPNAKNSALFIPRQVLVKFKADQNAARQNKILKTFGAAAGRQLEKIGVQVVPVPASETAEAFIQKLQANDAVEFAEPNGVMRAFAAPSDPSFGSQYYLGQEPTPSSTDYINILPAWDITTGDPNVIVAVVDTGVVLTHPDISNNLWDSNGIHGARMFLDWNGDGDCNDTDPQAGPEMCFSLDPTGDDTDFYHGTHVAGIIAAQTNNGLNMAGIARNCKIMAVKVLNSEGYGTYEAIAAGIVFAADNGASVINMSLGGPSNSDTLTAAVNYAISKNVVLVAAAGNDGAPCDINYPAAIDRVISVGATNELNTLASFSCSRGALDVVAPGTNILSLVNNSGTSSGDGTSFSAPIVSGVAALIRSLQPSMSVTNVNKYIDFTANDLGIAGYDGTYGFGLVNAQKALNAVQAGTTYRTVPGMEGETFAYPKPFKPMLNGPLNFSIASTLGNGDIKITIFNMSGEEIRTLSGSVGPDGKTTATWDGKNSDGNIVGSGLYLYHLKTAQGNAKGKITVIK